VTISLILNVEVQYETCTPKEAQMYYEEKVIDGVLCWRGNPKDEFKPYTAEELTLRVVRAEALIDKARNLLTV
jgi:hypothetical protein